MNLRTELHQFRRQQQTRRVFLGRTAQGVGTFALASLLNSTAFAAAKKAAAAGALVRGMRWEDMDKLSRVSDHIVDGSLSEFNGGEGILIGVRMAERFGVRSGDELTLVSPNGNVTAFGSAPRDRKSTRLNSSHMSESRMPSSA